MLWYEKGFVRPPPTCSADWDRVRWTRAWRTYEMAVPLVRDPWGVAREYQVASLGPIPRLCVFLETTKHETVLFIRASVSRPIVIESTSPRRGCVGTIASRSSEEGRERRVLTHFLLLSSATAPSAIHP